MASTSLLLLVLTIFLLQIELFKLMPSTAGLTDLHINSYCDLSHPTASWVCLSDQMVISNFFGEIFASWQFSFWRKFWTNVFFQCNFNYICWFFKQNLTIFWPQEILSKPLIGDIWPWISIIFFYDGHHRKKLTQALEFPKNGYFVVFFYWDGCIGYKSRTYRKGYGIKWDAIGNVLRNTLGTWETCWENTLRTCWEQPNPKNLNSQLKYYIPPLTRNFKQWSLM